MRSGRGTRVSSSSSNRHSSTRSAFSEKSESYNLTAIDGKRTTKTFKQVHGVRSDGEFGALLKWIFQPESQTQFSWERSVRAIHCGYMKVLGVTVPAAQAVENAP